MRFSTVMSPVLTLCVNVGVVVVIWSGGLESIRGDLTVGQIVAFANYLLTTMIPLTMMAMISGAWAGGFASVRRVREVLETEPEVRDTAVAGALPEPVRGWVDFENVSFRFGGMGRAPVLEADQPDGWRPEQTVAIVGATGAGKSALVNLVPRDFTTCPPEGSPSTASISGASARMSLRAHIAVVPQETLLFSGTVRDNIAYGAPQAGEAEIIAAARAAQAHDFILAACPRRVRRPRSNSGGPTSPAARNNGSPSPGRCS